MIIIQEICRGGRKLNPKFGPCLMSLIPHQLPRQAHFTKFVFGVYNYTTTTLQYTGPEIQNSNAIDEIRSEKEY